MAAYKSNRVVLFTSAALVVILVLFAVLRDNADSITLGNAKIILQNNSVEIGRASCRERV